MAAPQPPEQVIAAAIDQLISEIRSLRDALEQRVEPIVVHHAIGLPTLQATPAPHRDAGQKIPVTTPPEPAETAVKGGENMKARGGRKL